ncbi:MAG TPA: EVE domain-containing protein [Gemmatimonadaceae bacterium]|nr:EVE domain-containing protein [Gemmatimonadaceae bacterium]
MTVTLPDIEARKELWEIAMLRFGRLSVTSMTAKEWDVILGMAA